MLLNEFVSINNTGLVADAVNFRMMNDPDKNLRLCQGFIFNLDSKNPKASTVGVLDAIRRSYHSRNEPNVHLMVQDYGKGKSHFALTVANFFKHSVSSPEVEGILNQIRLAAGTNNPILEDLRAYKQRSKKHLVICLSGDEGVDLKQLFLLALKSTLEAEGISDTLAQHVCSQPLHYLESLNQDELTKANTYLRTHNSLYGDVNSLIKLLREENYKAIPTVVGISREFNKGIPLNFEADLRLEEIIEDIVRQHCLGPNARFQGVLVLLDELNAYLQSYANNPGAAGGLALQNITNICENHKGQVALVCFTQIRPSNVSAVPLETNEISGYQKLISRLELASTYEPVSNLEMVLDALIIQEKGDKWNKFLRKWDSTLTNDSQKVFERYTIKYKEGGWPYFHKHFSMGCFPLHPLTSYLLCNLDFMQGRTAIQFIKEDLRNYLSVEDVEFAGRINYLHPVGLVDAFDSNFSNSAHYTEYRKAYDTIVSSAKPDELLVLKAIFLFYVSGNKLAKKDQESYEEILSILTGISTKRVKDALERLESEWNVIYQIPANNTYRFYSGFGLRDLKNSIEAEIAGVQGSIDDLVNHTQSKIREYFGSTTVEASQFASENKLVLDDWRFQRQVFTVESFISLLQQSSLRDVDGKGVLAYVIAESGQKLQNLRRDIDSSLQNSRLRNHIAVVIPTHPGDDLIRIRLKIKTLEKKSATEREKYGPAYQQLLEQLTQELDKRLKELIKSSDYRCAVLQKIPSAERDNPQSIISTLLTERYPFVPPVESIDKMRSNHATGTKIIGFVAKQLLSDNLSPQILPDRSYGNVIDPILVSSWQILKKSSQKYNVIIPGNKKVRTAWDKISQSTELGNQFERSVELKALWEELSDAPYGYNEFTFTALLAAWLAYHRSEVYIRGPFGIASRGLQSPQIKTASIKSWATETNILDKPKDFVSWLVKNKAILIRHKPVQMPNVPALVEYDQAQHLIKEIDQYLESSDAAKAAEAKEKKRQLMIGIGLIDSWFKGIGRAETLNGNESIEQLVEVYNPTLQNPQTFAVDKKTEVTRVIASEGQKDRQIQVQKNLRERVENSISLLSAHAENIATEVEYGTYKTEVQNTINRMKEASGLPPTFLERLQEALQNASRRLDYLKAQEKLNECNSKIESIFKALSNNASQKDYTRVRSEFELIASGVPGAADSSIYSELMQAIEDRQNALTSQLQGWQSRVLGLGSHIEATELKNEINRQFERYTEAESKQEVVALLSVLESKIIELAAKEDTKSAAKESLASARRKLQRIRDLSSPAEAFDVYQDLAQHVLPEGLQEPEKSEAESQLASVKAQGAEKITQSFLSLCKQRLKRPQEYESLRDELKASDDLLASTDLFGDLKASVQAALLDLEAQYDRILKAEGDQARIRDIRLYKPLSLNTILLCEDAIKSIEALRADLNNPQPYNAEIDELLQKIKAQSTNYQSKLQLIHHRMDKTEGLKQVEDMQTDYARLEFLFKDSSFYQTYQELRGEIVSLKEDFERVEELERHCKELDSIRSCQKALEYLADEGPKIKDSKRFSSRIFQIEEHIKQKAQSYISDLSALEENLDKLDSVQAAARFEEELNSKLPVYIGAQQEASYKSIVSECRLLSALLQITDESKKLDTIQFYDKKIEELDSWVAFVKEMPPRIARQATVSRKAWQEAREALVDAEAEVSRKWLLELNQQFGSVRQLPDASAKTDAANRIIAEIQTQKRRVEFLDDEGRQVIGRIESYCNEIRNSDIANRILIFFRELPLEQRKALYDKLKSYLVDEVQAQRTTVD